MELSGQSPAPAAEDAALLARLRRGEDAAFAELVAAHGGRLLAVTRRLLRNEDDAADAVQEALLSAFRALDRFEGTSRLSTWLHRIAVNAALMKLRKRSSQPDHSIESLLPQFQADGHAARPARPWDPGAAAALEQAETRALVRRMIDQLPENYRIVLLLRDIEGLDTDEAAAALGLQPGAVKTRLHRARQALRTLLDPHFARDADPRCALPMSP